MKLEPEWARYATPARIAEYISGGAWKAAPHHELISKIIASAVLDGNGRYLIQTPPQHGKSLLCAHWGPVWALNLDRRLRICVASYEAHIASGWGRRVRNTITEHADRLNVAIAADSKAKNVWHTDDPNGQGGMITVGMGGALTGRPVDLMIVDDPVKNADVARSLTYRNSHWEWWTHSAQTRLRPGGSVIVIQTRWHEDDLSGRLERDGGWKVVRLPALAEEGDVLGREVGDALWPTEYPADCPKFVEAQKYPRAWSALYQQRPQPSEGSVFRRDHFHDHLVGFDLDNKLVPGDSLAFLFVPRGNLTIRNRFGEGRCLDFNRHFASFVLLFPARCFG